MDLRHLRTFVVVAEQRTISKASDHLRIAQPALSRQIAHLEAELGVQLFDRIRRRLILTADGERLLVECRGIVKAADSLGERAKQLRRPDAGVLRVAATPQMIDGVFSRFLHRYAAQFPDVQIKLTEAVGTEPFVKLERGELDLVVNYMQVMQTESHEFDSLPLPPLDFLAAGHPSLPLGHGSDIEIRRLAQFPLLLLDSSYGVRTTFDA